MITDSLKIRFGAVTLVLVTLTAVVFSLINFQQREEFQAPDDGVSWLDTPFGRSRVERIAGFACCSRRHPQRRPHPRVNGAKISRAAQVTEHLLRAGLWSEVHYTLVRGGDEITVPVITGEQSRPLTFENYLRVVGLVYLFIGLIYFCAAVERSARGSLLRFLPRLVHPVFVPFHGKVERV